MSIPLWKPTWDLTRSFDWNYTYGPNLFDGPTESLLQQPTPFLTWQLRSPIGIAAGPLLNARFIKAYAQLGYSILTYKTVRSCEHPAHPAPVLARLEYTSKGDNISSQQFIGHSDPGNTLPATLSSANSVGLPSYHPKFWREDVRRARAFMGDGQILVVSVVGTSKSGDSTEQLADDFAQCAQWAVEAGADMIEVNLSCPNVRNEESDVYLDPAASTQVVKATRAAIGSAMLSAKLGYYADKTVMQTVLDSITPFLNALTLINAVKFPIIAPDGTPYFPGSTRAYAGVGGAIIRPFAQNNVQYALQFLKQRSLSIPVIAVGGITEPHHVDEYLALGATIVEIATTAIWQPFFLRNYVLHESILGA